MTTPVTDPATLPRDVRGKLLNLRAALLQGDIAEAHHHLYAIADPTFESFTPWTGLETGFPEVEEHSVPMDMAALAHQLNLLLHRPTSAYLGNVGPALIGNIHCRCDREHGASLKPEPLYRCLEIINREGGCRDYLHGMFTAAEMLLALQERIKKESGTCTTTN
jgi:hypothetical protein